MELAYFPSVVMCVQIATGAGGRPQAGAFAVLLTLIAYAVHVLLVAVAEPAAGAS